MQQEKIKKAIQQAITDGLVVTETNLSGEKYSGKVRDVYKENNQLTVVSTDRISAFDHVFKTHIPFKGQVLNQISAYFLQKAKSAGIPVWYKESLFPNISTGLYCEPIRIEVIVRNYITGSAWRKYADGQRVISGITFPDGLCENQWIMPVITPTNKSLEGHDEDITEEEILSKRLINPDRLHGWNDRAWHKIKLLSKSLFKLGRNLAKKRGLILVDTKYEFGLDKHGEVVLIDEVHTPDSSRYWYLNEYEDRFQKSKPQKQLSKEFFREWLMQNGFEGKEGQIEPVVPDEIIAEISQRYIDLYETITGEEFVPATKEQIRSLNEATKV